MTVEINEMTFIRRDNTISLMQDGGWTREQFSEKTKIPKQTLNAFLGKNPKSNVGTKTKLAIESACNKSEGWLDKDRRKVTDADIPACGPKLAPVSEGSLSMRADGFIVENRPLTKFQARAIMMILLED